MSRKTTYYGASSASAALFLDLYGTDILASYSLEKVRTDYAGPCIRVREDTGNTEADIGFDGDILDTTALLAHCNGASGYVVEWYDQSGNDYHVDEANLSLQPRIVNAGVVDTENGNPTVNFDAVNGSRLRYGPFGRLPADIPQPIDVFSVINFDAAATLLSGISNEVVIRRNSGIIMVNAGVQLDVSGIDNGSQSVYNFVVNGANSQILKDGVLEASGNAGTNLFRRIYISAGSGRTMNLVQELHIFAGLKNADRAAMTADLNTRYNVYP